MSCGCLERMFFAPLGRTAAMIGDGEEGKRTYGLQVMAVVTTVVLHTATGLFGGTHDYIGSMGMSQRMYLGNWGHSAATSAELKRVMPQPNHVMSGDVLGSTGPCPRHIARHLLQVHAQVLHGRKKEWPHVNLSPVKRGDHQHRKTYDHFLAANTSSSLNSADVPPSLLRRNSRTLLQLKPLRLSSLHITSPLPHLPRDLW